MRSLPLIFIGVLISTSFWACSMGSKKVDYDNFPIRSKEFSIWMKCTDGDQENVCKYVCTKYKKNNECKANHEKIVKMKISKALDNGFMLISKPYLLYLIKNKK